MSKYKSRQVSYNGEVFDSKKEYYRFRELEQLQMAGKIENLKRQVKYILIPAQREFTNEIYTSGRKKGCFKPGKLLEREVAYIADFVYTETDTGKLVVEDVKGYRRGTAYSVFTIKRKLMLKEYGIQIKET